MKHLCERLWTTRNHSVKNIHIFTFFVLEDSKCVSSILYILRDRQSMDFIRYQLRQRKMSVDEKVMKALFQEKYRTFSSCLT